MNTPELLESFATDLVRRGLPVDYARGSATELADHHRDLVEELRAGGLSQTTAEDEAANRLGDHRMLVKKAVREFQLRHWCGRWPLLTFFLGPVPLVILLWAATTFVWLMVVWPMQQLGIIAPHEPDGILSWGEWAVVYGFRYWFFFVTPALVVCYLGRRVSRSSLSCAWLLLSAALLALFTGNFLFIVRPGQLMISTPEYPVLLNPSLSWAESLKATWLWYTQTSMHTFQTVLPLAIAAVLVWRSKQREFRSHRRAVGNC
jgi:hypothetical protein